MSGKLIPQLTDEQENSLLTEVSAQLLRLHGDFPRLLLEVLEANPSRTMPYHNNFHTILFLRATIMAWDISELSLTESEKLNLAVAALHHDYDYRTTGEDDWENISAAVASISHSPLRAVGFHEALVKELIEATYLAKELNPEDEGYRLKTIMRDSDLLGWIYPEFRRILARGLKEEKGYEPFASDFLKHFKIYNGFAVNALEDAGLA